MPEEGSHETGIVQNSVNFANADTHKSTSNFTDEAMPKLQKEVDAIMQRVLHVDTPNDIGERASAIEEKILDTTETLEYANDLLDALTKFLDKLNRLSSLGRSAMFPSVIATIAIAGLNLITTPVLYIASFILGGKPKINSKQISNLAYYSLIFGVALIGLLVPGASAIVGLVAAIGVAGMAVYEMAQTYHNYKFLKIQAAEMQTKIAGLEENLQGLIERAKARYSAMGHLIMQSPYTIKLYNETKKNYEALHKLGEEIDDKKAELEALKEKQNVYDKKIKNIHIGEVVHRGIEVMLASVALAGTIATFLFPPVGLGILAAGAALGGVYILARTTYPWIKRAIAWVKESVKTDEAFLQKEKLHVHQDVNVYHVDESTAMMNDRLIQGAREDVRVNQRQVEPSAGPAASVDEQRHPPQVEGASKFEPLEEKSDYPPSLRGGR